MDKLKKLRKFYKKYERLLIPGALLFGFVTDLLTFHLINFTFATLLLLAHIVFIGVNIGVINFYEEKIISGKIFSYWRVLAPLFLQYSFGNLFSAFFIFYSHSGSFSASWPFIGVIVFLMIGNEVFRKYNVRPSIQITVYFFAVFSYFNLIFPYIFNSLSVFIFVLSSFVSLGVIIVFIKILSLYLEAVRKKIKFLFFAIGSVFVVMNFLYFLNLIPPIPLSIKDIGVYHIVKRTGDNYLVKTEDCSRWDRCIFLYEKRHISSARQVLFLYSAVYAPEGMELKVTNEWQKYNDDSKKWETRAEIPFHIKGGRDIGYRWYSYYNVDAGLWRVNVKTERGQTIGRKYFHVVQGEDTEKKLKEI